MSDKDRFYQHVTQRASGIREQIDGLKSRGLDATARDANITRCLTEVNNLKTEISTHAYETAPHDQRTFDEILRGLKKQLDGVRSEVAPKQKFAFKPKPQPASTDQASKALESFPVAGSSFRPTDRPSNNSAQDPTGNDTGFGGSQQPSLLNNVYHALRTESDSEHADRGLTIADSSHSIIQCLIPCPKLTLNQVQSCLIVSGPINGGALVIGMTASVLAISCRQLRLHHCQDCILYLRCSSRPIIEDCSGMRFAPFPDDLDVVPLAGTTSDCWDQVDDFKWLKAGQSPNWSILKPEDRVEAHHWKVLRNVIVDRVGEILQAFGTTGLADQHAARA